MQKNEDFLRNNQMKAINRIVLDLGIVYQNELQEAKIVAWLSAIPYEELIRPLIINEHFVKKYSYQKIANRYNISKGKVRNRIVSYKECVTP